MKTLAQIRAKNALDHKTTVQQALSQSGQGDALSGFPMLIKTDGLLAALAFAVERKHNQQDQLVPKHQAHLVIAVVVASHLSSDRVGICDAQNADDLVEELAHAEDNSQLRRATAEALAFLNYLKRFVA